MPFTPVPKLIFCARYSVWTISARIVAVAFHSAAWRARSCASGSNAGAAALSPSAAAFSSMPRSQRSHAAKLASPTWVLTLARAAASIETSPTLTPLALPSSISQ